MSEPLNRNDASNRREVFRAMAGGTFAGVFSQSAEAQNSAQKQRGVLGNRLRGVQHFGITVQNMNRTFEFYTEVLGATEVMRDGDFHGEPIQNTLLLHEEIQAKQQHVNPRTLGIPDLRNGAQRLDVRFVQFDNMVIELLQYRDREQPEGTEGSFAPPNDHTSPAFPGLSHICFYIKDDVNFEEFMRELEAEASRRKMRNVKANRTTPAASDAERLKSPPGTNTNPIKQGKSNGWSLMYCKGPEGEQLEFVQVLGPVKHTFDESLEERRKGQ